MKTQHTLQQVITGQTSNGLEQRNHGSPASPRLPPRKALCAPRAPVGLPGRTITTPGAETLPPRNSSPSCTSFPSALLSLLTEAKWLPGYTSTQQLMKLKAGNPASWTGRPSNPRRGHPALGLLSDPTVTLASRTQPLSRRPVLVHRLFLREQGPKRAKSQPQKLPRNPRPS